MKFPLLLALALTVSAAHAKITLLATHDIPGTTKDKSKGQDLLGGLGSGIAWTGKGNRFVLIADRGPKDGEVDFLNRFHTMDIQPVLGATRKLEVSLLSTTMLTNEANDPFHGALTFLDEQKPERSLRLDPEAIRVSNDGTYLLSDEYGPYVWEFDAKGKKIRAFALPEKFLLKKYSKDPKNELPPHNDRGRQANRGLEGLAISPDGSKLYAILQSPLIQDGALNEKNERIGHNCRVLEIDAKTEATRELVYPLESPGMGVNEILAVNDHQFLVLERDGKPGKESEAKKIFLIDIEGATDVSAIAKLPKHKLPKEIAAVKKTLFLDMLDKKFGLVDTMPEKLEGLAFGPDLADGRHFLIVTSDNDFVVAQPFRLYGFAIDRKDLPGLQLQKFGK